MEKTQDTLIVENIPDEYRQAAAFAIIQENYFSKTNISINESHEYWNKETLDEFKGKYMKNLCDVYPNEVYEVKAGKSKITLMIVFDENTFDFTINVVPFIQSLMWVEHRGGDALMFIKEFYDVFINRLEVMINANKQHNTLYPNMIDLINFYLNGFYIIKEIEETPFNPNTNNMLNNYNIIKLHKLFTDMLKSNNILSQKEHWVFFNYIADYYNDTVLDPTISKTFPIV